MVLRSNSGLGHYIFEVYGSHIDTNTQVGLTASDQLVSEDATYTREEIEPAVSAVKQP